VGVLLNERTPELLSSAIAFFAGELLAFRLVVVDPCLLGGS